MPIEQLTESDQLYLGFDLSTQQLKIVVTNGELKLMDSFHVEFDKEFGKKKEYAGLKKGVYTDEESGEVVSPVAMWLESIDYVFGEMKKNGFPFAKVRGISGSCQQHGSVFWNEKGADKLKSLEKKPEEKDELVTLLDGSFALDTSPNWQDHSTGEEIEDFERCVGGSEQLARITGSRAHYRFTGLQIKKVAKKRPEIFQKTARISLVSSFVESVLLGKYANIEAADGCGMNLLNMKNGDLYGPLLELIGLPLEIKSKLGDINPITYSSTGSICNYFVEKYGFSQETKIFPFTGDNLATILSLPLEENDILVSLGTSTTVLLVTKQFAPSSQYHLFNHPTMPEHYMGMICYCNGSLAREKIRDEVNVKYNIPAGSWEKFDEIVDSSSTFDSKLGIYFPLGEIVPNAKAQTKRSLLLNGELKLVESWEIEEDATSIVESQALSCRVRLGPMLNKESSESEQFASELVSKFGKIITDGKEQTISSLSARPNRVYFVGGGLKNTSIISKMGSILGSTKGNFRVDMPNSCALGGAFRASWGAACETQERWIDYNKYLNDKFDYSSVEKLQIKDKWKGYFDGIGMLAKMEQELEH